MSQAIFSDGLGYEGKVTLTLKGNNQILKSKTYKNSGTAQLFKFLGCCLIDAYEEAKSLMPNKIMLLHNNSTSPTDTEASPTNVVQCTDFVPYVHAPTMISDGDTSQAKVVYSFEIPRNMISSDDGAFNQVALYGAGITDIRDFSAFYYLTDAHGWEDPEVDLWSATTVLLIEWELSLSNKNTETNNS
jgi:hypothetical protein